MENNWTIIGWPEIQYYMDEEGFEDNSSLLEPNDNLGIGSSTYIINTNWLNSL